MLALERTKNDITIATSIVYGVALVWYKHRSVVASWREVVDTLRRVSRFCRAGITTNASSLHFVLTLQKPRGAIRQFREQPTAIVASRGCAGLPAWQE